MPHTGMFEPFWRITCESRPKFNSQIQPETGVALNSWRFIITLLRRLRPNLWPTRLLLGNWPGMPQPLGFFRAVQVAVSRDHAGVSGVCVNGSREDVPGDPGARLNCAHDGSLANCPIRAQKSS